MILRKRNDSSKKRKTVIKVFINEKNASSLFGDFIIDSYSRDPPLNGTSGALELRISQSFDQSLFGALFLPVKGVLLKMCHVEIQLVFDTDQKNVAQVNVTTLCGITEHQTPPIR